MILSKEEFLDWKNHPATEALVNYLIKSCGDTQDNWLNGAYSTEADNAKAQGSAWALASMMQVISEGSFIEEITQSE